MFVFYQTSDGSLSFTMDGDSYPDRLLSEGIGVLETELKLDDLHKWKVEDGALVEQIIEPTTAMVTAERDRRMQLPFSYAVRGTIYMADCDEKSLARITGAATLAGFAAGAGAPSGYYLWSGGTEPFRWIMHDNSQVELDAPETFGLGQAAAHWQSEHIFASDALKHMVPIPQDYTDDTYWP